MTEQLPPSSEEPTSRELAEMGRSGVASRSLRAERDAPTLRAMKRLAAQYPRYGYRSIRVSLEDPKPNAFKTRHHSTNPGAVVQS